MKEIIVILLEGGVGMRLTISRKFVGTLFIFMIICSAVVLFVSIWFMKKPIDEELEANIRKLQNVIQTANEQTASRFAQSALLISHQEDLARAILANDNPKVMDLSKKAMQESGSDFMTVTDASGKVVGRGHSKKWQDSVLNQETVVKALGGEPAAAIVAGTVVPFTIRASQPVFLDGKLAGTLSIGTSLVAPPYLDWLKNMSGMDVSIYKGNSRVMTTLMKNGERAVGVKVESPQIEDAVLKRGELVFTQNNVDGVEYESAYWPMRTADGKISGIWFVGMPVSNLQSLEQAAIYNTIWVALGLLALLLLAAMFIGARISRPISEITKYAVKVGHGDANAVLDVHGQDDMGELADSLRSMVGKQNQLLAENSRQMEQARKQAEESAALEKEARIAHQEALDAQHKGMAEAAEQILAVVRSLDDAINSIATQVEQSEGALNQAASRLAGTATAMEEMNSTVLEVAKNVGLAADISASARDRAVAGAEIVTQSVAGIQEVHNQSLSLKKDMGKLDEHARSIDKIMGVISDIADQTNLLALNAAIEAARAGDAGRGFAVVADEVRKLAEKTMSSTTEVGSAIQAIQESAKESTQQVERAVQNIAQANALSSKSGEMLQEILDMVEHTADEVRAIAAASEEQSAASEEITRSIGEINDISHSTSDAMRTAADSLEDLRRRSQELLKLVDEMQRA